jgi:hypothetical protein
MAKKKVIKVIPVVAPAPAGHRCTHPSAAVRGRSIIWLNVFLADGSEKSGVLGR